MSKTIAEKLIVLSDGLTLINQERDYQTELILNLQDTIEELSTPIAQTAPLISIDNETGVITATVTQEQGGYVPMGTLNTTLIAKNSIAALAPTNIKAGVNILGVAGTYTSDATADATHILKDKIAYSKGSKITGSMTNNGAVSPTALNAGGSYTIPAGYHNGSGKVTTNSLASQTSANAAASQIVEGKTAWVNGSKITGTMTDHGGIAMSLALGGSYTIPAGYHNGGGKVTTQSLSSQTSGTAAASHIVKDKTAWVNGSKITGTMTELTEISPNSVASLSVDSWSPTSGVTVPVLKLTNNANREGGYITPTTKLTTFTTMGEFGNATANQVLSGSTFTSSAGFKATGTIPTISSIAKQGQVTYEAGTGDILFDTQQTTAGYIAANTPITIAVESDAFGNATADQVLSGRTFTSREGLMTTGTVKNMNDNWITLDSFDYDGDVNVRGVLNEAIYIPKGGTLKAYAQGVDLEGAMLWHYLPLLIQGNQPWGIQHSDGHDDEYFVDYAHEWYDGFEHIVDDYGYDPYYWWDISITDSSSCLNMSAYNDNPRLTLRILVRNSVSWIDGYGGQSEYANLYNTLVVPPQEEVTFSESYDMLQGGQSIDWDHTIIGWRWTKK